MHYAWHPGHSEPELRWAVPSHRQDVVEGAVGDKLVIVRSGFEAPIADWELILKDERSGQNCLLAVGDEDIISFRPKTFGVPWAHPTPSASGSRLVWIDWHDNGAGGFTRRLRLYDAEAGEVATLAEALDAKTEGIWEPSIHGDRVAWLQKKNGREMELIVRDLETDEQQSYLIPAEPFKATLFDDGRRWAWDTPDGAFVFDFETGNSIRYSNVGGNTLATGPYVSTWVAPDWIGYFDASSGEFQPIDNQGSITITNFIFGNYYIWQERRPDPADPAPAGEKREISRFFAIKLVD